MKHTTIVSLFLSAALVVVSLTGISQEEKKVSKKSVPAAVLAAFKAAYPNAAIKGTSKERENGETFYEIESVDGKQKRDVLYKSDGTVAEIEEAVELSSIPQPARDFLKTNHPKDKISTVEKLTENGKIAYEVGLMVKGKRVELKFDEMGKKID